MSDCDSGSKLLTEVNRLLYKLAARARRIEELEGALREVKATLSTMTEFHWQDEILISDGLTFSGAKDMEDYARDHISKNGAEVLGRRMLDEGYMKVTEVRHRDERYMGRWFRVSLKAIVTKATTRAERQVRKNEQG